MRAYHVAKGQVRSMAGANYMGGRVNAAKARVRDADGRMQRNHFGKQKLAVLSRGLHHRGNDGKNIQSAHKDDAISSIGFAHAQQARSRESYSNETEYRGNENKQEMSTPPPKRRRTDSGPSRSELSSGSRDSKSQSSRLLRELDLSEPLCMRAQVKRLLGFSDFAGLSRTSPSLQLGTPPDPLGNRVLTEVFYLFSMQYKRRQHGLASYTAGRPVFCIPSTLSGQQPI
ncbi:hypothetical protein NM688_g8628 [Phlebia brevispora]|uniref:Uncharacterized protein n=1 Tax=Phlebia brevispora TaxID=194682 RepID=A0ACC1RQS5_9APHY|nr:hypothetical protein NM688_g8628 [Phlebia brevispora]